MSDLPTATLTASGSVLLHRAPYDGVLLDAVLLTAEDARAISEAVALLPPRAADAFDGCPGSRRP